MSTFEPHRTHAYITLFLPTALIVLLSLLGCTIPQPSPTPQPTRSYAWDNEEYWVYSVWLAEQYGGYKGTLVIQEDTHAWSFGMGPNLREWIKERIPSITTEFIDDFETRNKISHRIDNRSVLSNATIVNSSDLKAAYRDENVCKQFDAKYPLAQIVFFSRVGLDSKREQAIFHVRDAFVYTFSGRGCRVEAGSGKMVFLIKISGRWIIKEKMTTFIS
ncbi:MAG: hypothetical protein HZC40_02145 [Chloroflexi bacterium]|nr:hypothetical protein [Chloroflexota bacterium]